MENENNQGSSVPQAEAMNNYGANYGQTGNAQQPPLKPNNHMALAIITTVCCCLPFGIVGIVKASQVNSLYLSRQYAAAQKSADDAKKWSIIGIIIGVVIWVIYMAVYGIAFLAALGGSH